MKKFLLSFVALAATATLASCGGDSSSSFQSAAEIAVTNDIGSIYQVAQPSKVETAVNLSESLTPEIKVLFEPIYEANEKFLGVKPNQELKNTVKDEISNNSTFTSKVKTDLGVEKDETINYSYYIKNLKNENVWVSTYTVIKDNESAKSLSDLTFKDSFSAETVYIYYFEASDGTLTEGSSRHLYFKGNGSKVSYGDTSAANATSIGVDGGSHTLDVSALTGMAWIAVAKDYKSISQKTKVELGSITTSTSYSIKNLSGKYKAIYELAVTEQKESETLVQEGYFTVKYDGSYTFTWE